MPNKKYDYAVMHVQSGSFVTEIGANKVAYWKAGESAKLFSKEFARDLAYGLTLNGNTALVVEVPVYISDLRNSEEKEDKNNG